MGRKLVRVLLQPLVNWRQQTNALIERIVEGWSATLPLLIDAVEKL
jgi:hypothetical protein